MSLQSMNRDGILEKQDINTLWKSTEFLKHKDFIICLMCHLDILVVLMSDPLGYILLVLQEYLSDT
jgi:hypothetical protein